MTPLSTLYNSLILKGLKFNNFLAKNCKPSIYRALEKRVESQVTMRSKQTTNHLKDDDGATTTTTTTTPTKEKEKAKAERRRRIDNVNICNYACSK